MFNLRTLRSELTYDMKTCDDYPLSAEENPSSSSASQITESSMLLHSVPSAKMMLMMDLQHQKFSSVLREPPSMIG